MAAKLLKKRFNIKNVNSWLAENDENMDGKLKHTNKFNFHLIKLIFIMYNTDYWVLFIAQKMIKRLFTGVKFFICK